MTDFDKALIEKANKINRWDYRYIDTFVKIADTVEARRMLEDIRANLYDDVLASI